LFIESSTLPVTGKSSDAERGDDADHDEQFQDGESGPAPQLSE
jgi:hypothetical protein